MMEQMHQMPTQLRRRGNTHRVPLISPCNSGRITKNMEQVADPINGLVDVARQSHEMQQINMLYRQ